jgi:hypothetical protein
MHGTIHHPRCVSEYQVHALVFEYEDYLGHTIDFPCDKLGGVHLGRLTIAQHRLWKDCLSGYVPIWKGLSYDKYMAPIPGIGYLQYTPVLNRGISTTTKSQVLAGTVECLNCAQDVILHGFFNACQCGLKYNQAGHLLGDRADWTETQCNNFINTLLVDPEESSLMFENTARMQLETLHFERIKRASRS